LSSTVAVALLSPRSISGDVGFADAAALGQGGEREALGVAQFAQAVGDELVDVHGIQYTGYSIL
jgi:hypothetical protein